MFQNSDIIRIFVLNLKISTMKKLFAPLCVVLFTISALCCSCSKSIVRGDEIRDLVLIYDGGDHRTIDWNKEKFAPYVATDAVDGKPAEWLFDGFLFLEIYCTQERGFAKWYRDEGARKEDWVGLIDQYLSPHRDITALNECVGEKRLEIGGEFHRRKVVLSLPEPIAKQTDWGELNGRSLDFNNDMDRLIAVKWYIDLLIERFTEAELENLQLSGFYWLTEQATHTRTFVRDVADYIHSKGLDFYWIPYFGSDGYTQTREFGFDYVYLQPNHFFHPHIPDSRIQEAVDLARKEGISNEMEFDERVLQSNGNRGERLAAYIDTFERNGLFENNNLAYYQGNDAFYQLKYGSELDRSYYKRLSEIIARRQREFYKEKR